MSLSEDNGMVMPVAPMYGYGNGNNGNGLNGDWGSWIILFLLFGLFNGNGNGWGGGGMMGGGGSFPWMLANNTDNLVTAGFANQGLNSTLNGIQNAVTSGFGDVQTALCGGFAGVNASINGAQNAVSQQLYTNQIADMERSFAAQTANTQGMSALQAQLAQCCCDNRLATAQTQALVQSENCADRAALSDGIRDIITNQTAGVQRILDKLCDSELQAERRENANLRQELIYARGQESQIDQTAQIRAGQTAAVNSLINELRSCPIPAQPVYGSQPIFTCPQNNNNGCGCGCGNNF